MKDMVYEFGLLATQRSREYERVKRCDKTFIRCGECGVWSNHISKKLIPDYTHINHIGECVVIPNIFSNICNGK